MLNYKATKLLGLFCILLSSAMFAGSHLDETACQRPFLASSANHTIADSIKSDTTSFGFDTVYQFSSIDEMNCRRPTTNALHLHGSTNTIDGGNDQRKGEEDLLTANKKAVGEGQITEISHWRSFVKILKRLSRFALMHG